MNSMCFSWKERSSLLQNSSLKAQIFNLNSNSPVFCLVAVFSWHLHWAACSSCSSVLSGQYLVPRCYELHMIITFLFEVYSWILMGNPMVDCFWFFFCFFPEWASVTDKLNYDGILFLREIKIPLCLSRCLPGDIYCKYVKFLRITSFLTVNTNNWKQLSPILCLQLPVSANQMILCSHLLFVHLKVLAALLTPEFFFPQSLTIWGHQVIVVSCWDWLSNLAVQVWNKLSSMK